MPRANHDDPRPGSAGNVALRGNAADKRGKPATTGTTAHGSGAGPVTDSRIVAAQICADIRGADLLDSAFDARVAAVPLDARDRRWTRTLVYGMLRQRARLDAFLDACVSGGVGRLDADVMDLLRLGAYQLLYMNGVPAYAAIGQTVELVKTRHGIGASKLANAVLRRIDRERDTPLRQPPGDKDASELVQELALEYSHPQWLVARWLGRWSADETRALLAANNEEAPLIARPMHIVPEQLEAVLEAAGLEVEEAPLVRDSLLLSGIGPTFTELGAFKQGLFHLQDPASTLVTLYACVPSGATVADLCAAPGGKSAELSRQAGWVHASDLSTARIARVRENIARLELANVSAYIADARRPACGPVDFVLIDVPCSGTGTFRRHPDARWRLKASDIPTLAALQQEILRGAASVVRPGGLLVYATCSLEPEENDAQIDAFLRENPAWRLDPPPVGVVPATVLDDGRLRVVPQTHGTDGAFAARLRRTA